MEIGRLTRPIVTINHVRPDIGGGLRSAVSFLPPVVVGLALGDVFAATVAGLASQLTALVDTGGSVQRRMRQMFFFVIAAGIIVPLSVGAAEYWLSAALLMSVAAFLGGVLSLYGAFGAAMALAVPILTLLMMALGVSPDKIWLLTLFALIGGLWAMVVSMIPWLVRRNQPALAAVAGPFQHLAEICTTLRAAGAHWEHDPTVELARQKHGTIIAGALEEAKFVRVGGVSGRSLLSVAEDLLVATLATAEDGLTDDAQRTATDEFLTELSQYCNGVSDAILHEKPMAQFAPSRQYDNTAIARDVAAIVRITGRFSDERPTGSRLTNNPNWDALVSGLQWNAPGLRHAARLAVAAGIATLVNMWSGIPQGDWIILTVVVLMKPDIGATWDRISQRFVGTFIGVLIGGLLIELLSGKPYIVAIVAAVFLFAMVALIKINYLFWVIPLTPFVLLTMSLSQPYDWELSIWRLVNTVIGTLISVLAAYYLWPSDGRRSALRAMRNEISLMHGYLAAIISAYPDDKLRKARLRTFYAEQELRATLKSWRNAPDPPLAEIDEYEDFLTQLTSLRTLLILLDHMDRVDSGSWQAKLAEGAGVATADLFAAATVDTKSQTRVPAPKRGHDQTATAASQAEAPAATATESRADQLLVRYTSACKELVASIGAKR